jgi:hypothetical protein
MGNLFRNLFIPQKNLPQFDPQAFATDMRAIENWANQINMSFDTSVGSAIPFNVAPTMQMRTLNLAATAGFATYAFITPFKYGYTALVSSGDATAADSMALGSASTLSDLQVYATLGGAPVTASVVVVALLVGA